MSKVILKRATYDYAALKPLFFEIMDALGGDAIKSSSRVVIKPNLLAPATPEKAIVTHPLIVKAAVEYVLQKGARPQISDSPALGSFERVLKESGIKSALAGLDVEYKEFKRSVAVDIGEPFHKIMIAEDAVTADFLINLPKLKTHAQMLLTLGVKNLFGCIVGFSKPEWHFRTGVDREMFAQLLVQIYRAVRPGITVVDGILAMEGQGPGKSGTPISLGVLLGSNDAVALDRAVCMMLGIRPESMPTNRAAAAAGLAQRVPDIIGQIPEVKDFKLPEITSLVFGPSSFQGLMRRHLVQRPVGDNRLCKLCGECWNYCPAKALRREGERLHFDYDKCIRCSCCLEVCPHGAITMKETVPGKVLRNVVRKAF